MWHSKYLSLCAFCVLSLIVTSAEGGYVFTSVCLSVRRITEKVVNGL